MSGEVLSTRALNRATLARQMLLAREAVPVADAVGRLGGLQAQEPKPPFLALWSRVEGFAADDLRAALHERSLVRAMLMRATLHLVTASDYAVLRPAVQPALAQAMRGALRGRMEGLDLDRLLPVARELLAEGPHTFDELRPRLLAAFPEADERALGYAVRTQLPLVMTPTDDAWGFPRDAAFTPSDTGLGAPDAGEAGAEALVLSHLAAFGPATAADTQAWSGVTGLKAAFEALRPRLETFADERGRELFDLPDAPRPGQDVAAPPRLLPEFDSLVLAHADRTRIIADAHRPGLVTKNLRVRATFLLDGMVAGTWTVERKRRTATLRLAPFGRVAKRAAAALEREAEAMVRFAEPEAAEHAVATDVS